MNLLLSIEFQIFHLVAESIGKTSFRVSKMKIVVPPLKFQFHLNRINVIVHIAVLTILRTAQQFETKNLSSDRTASSIYLVVR